MYLFECNIFYFWFRNLYLYVEFFCVLLDLIVGLLVVEYLKWCLDESVFYENIKKMLVRFCGLSFLVFSDVNVLYLVNIVFFIVVEW